MILFRWQTKPRMTIHGDLYYEGKEFETRLREKKPGDLSEELRTALGMPVGPGSHKVPTHRLTQGSKLRPADKIRSVIAVNPPAVANIIIV